jgi:outer membrane PBP1 activator LpoA protein
MANHSDSGSASSLGHDTAAPVDGCQLDSAGHVILKLLHKAAGAAEANSRRALETAQQLSTQLHAAQNRIAELEAEVQLYREKYDRAEEWLRKIAMEIEDRLIKQPQEQRRQLSLRPIEQDFEFS